MYIIHDKMDPKDHNEQFQIDGLFYSWKEENYTYAFINLTIRAKHEFIIREW